MSRIASYVKIEHDNAVRTCREALQECRYRLARMAKDPQKDGADSEVLVKAFAKIDRALDVLL